MPAGALVKSDVNLLRFLQANSLGLADRIAAQKCLFVVIDGSLLDFPEQFRVEEVAFSSAGFMGRNKPRVLLQNEVGDAGKIGLVSVDLNMRNAPFHSAETFQFRSVHGRIQGEFSEWRLRGRSI